MYNVGVVASVIDHVEDIMIVEKLSFKIPWSKESIIEEITQNKFARYISAQVNDRIVGYAGIWCICGEGHITNVAVHPEFRGNNIGSMLVEGIIKIAKDNGVTYMTLEVRKSNVVAQNLYKKFGFEECSIRKAYYADNGEDALVMCKHNI